LKLKAAFRMTIVVVTHELASAFVIADRVTVMHEGEVLVVGTPEEIRNCEHPHVRHFLNRTPEGDERDVKAYLRSLTESGL
jgi:phospholipid/cholesterol/gamma-HCH transport system ATP-binding protein